MAQSSKLHFIMTGGTIDSYYNGIQDTAIPNEYSSIPKFLKILRLLRSANSPNKMD